MRAYLVHHKTRAANGFTLIELLVVISIIGLLSSMVMVALNNARIKARDAKRIADVRQLVSALNLYYQNHNQYPDVTPGGNGCWGAWQAGNTINGSGIQFMQPLVSDGIISKAPLENTNILDIWNSHCIYRYMRMTGLAGSCGYNNVAAIYILLEQPRSSIPGANSGTAPGCVSSTWGWGEAGPGDPNGYLVMLPE